MSKERPVVYPYIPNSAPKTKARMLKEVGVQDVMELYAEIPDSLKYHEKLNLPEPVLDEYSIKRHVEGMLNKNKNCSEYLNFLGAGCAQHFVPAVCDEINGRAEFLTAYGSDAHSDHGKWQAMFEFTSLLAELLDMVRLTDDLPLYRALVGIQPDKVDWDEKLTPEIESAIPFACQHATSLLEQWQ